MRSESACSLAREIRSLRTKATKRIKRTTVLVNWGRGDLQVRGFPFRVINKPEAVRKAANKVEAFKVLKNNNIPTVDWTTDRMVASTWRRSGEVVYARHVINGSKGIGIELVTEGDNIPSAPLYTKGVIKAHEYRVHVFGGNVIDFTKKKRRGGNTEASSFVKNFSNGWVFCRDGVDLPDQVRDAALKSVSCLGLPSAIFHTNSGSIHFK